MFKRTFLCFQIKEDSLSQIIDDGRQILTFKIPLDVSGAAGLGLSVKGKARAVGGNDRDSPMENGIFVKSVIAGGAAAKVGDRSEELWLGSDRKLRKGRKGRVGWCVRVGG